MFLQQFWDMVTTPIPSARGLYDVVAPSAAQAAFALLS